MKYLHTIRVFRPSDCGEAISRPRAKPKTNILALPIGEHIHHADRPTIGGQIVSSTASSYVVTQDGKRILIDVRKARRGSPKQVAANAATKRAEALARQYVGFTPREYELAAMIGLSPAEVRKELEAVR